MNADYQDSILNEPLQFNNNLKRGKEVISNTEWSENNIITLRDLTNNDGLTFMDFRTFKRKYPHTPNTHFLCFNGIVHSAK